MNKIRHLMTLAFLCFVLINPAAATEVDSFDGFELKIKLIMSDGRVFQPSATLLAGKQATLTLNDVYEETSPLQLRLRAMPRTDETYFVSAQVLELVDRKWTILNEAEAAGYLGTALSFDVGGDAYIEILGDKVEVHAASANSLNMALGINFNAAEH